MSLDLGMGPVERRCMYGIDDGLRVVIIHVESTECVGFVGECYVMMTSSVSDTKVVSW